MGRIGIVACLAAVILLAGCGATPTVTSSAASLAPGTSTAPGASVGQPGASAGQPEPSGGAPQSPAVAGSPGASAATSGGSSVASSPAGTPIPASALPRLVVTVSGTYRKTGNGPYAGTTDDYTFKSTNLVLEPLSEGKVSLHGRITLTETENLKGGVDCHGTFSATYLLTTTGTISGDPAAPVYQIQIALAHPPVDEIKLHCAYGTISIAKSPHGALIAAWSGILGPIDVPYLGGSFKLSASGALPYFDVTATASFSARRG